MDAFGTSDNLSQSDLLVYNSQMENFFSESFGSRFNNMNPLNESDIRNNLNGTAKDESDPHLCQYNYVGSQELNISRPQEYQDPFMPLNNDYRLPGEYLEEEHPGGLIHSQGLGESPFREHKFTVSVMPQSKVSNRDYLPQDGLLFVRFMAGIGLNFSLNDPEERTSMPMPPDMFIRMSLRFESPVSDDKKRVARCHVHADRDTNGLHKSFPFILNHRDAVYDDANLWVTFPACTVVTTTFYCYSSCAGGIDRKPIYLYFELLNSDGSLCQSARWNVKVCANPSRDGPKEQERRRKEEDKFVKGGVKSEASSEMKGGETVDKKGKKRKMDVKAEMGGEVKRMESASPMQPALTPSPAAWSPNMAAPRVSASSRRSSKLELSSPSSDGVATESNGCSRKTSSEDDEDKVFEIKIQGKKKYEQVMSYLKSLEQNERYSSRNDVDNPFENLTQLTGDISISTWLRQYRLEESDHYVDSFRSMGIYTLDDVENHFTPSLFHATIGIPQPAAARLNKIYLNWLNVNKAAD